MDDQPLQSPQLDTFVVHEWSLGDVASHPDVVAEMLDMLDVHEGHNVLEIGAGTGYNAALLKTLTGPTGSVTTVDINADVTAAARHHLDDTGFHNVKVITRDGADGAPEGAPYDRIIVTVGAWDVPHAWWDQLKPDGRLVLPLRWRGTSRAVSLVKQTDRLVADRTSLCGFVPMLGQYGERRHTIDADGLVTIHYDIDQADALNGIDGVRNREKTQVWSDLTVGSEEPFDLLWMHLSATHPGTARIQADRKAVDSGLCMPAVPIRSPALIGRGSLAYFSIRRTDEPGRWELGAIGHGRAGHKLAEFIVGQIRQWDTDRLADPALTIYPGNVALCATERGVVNKKETQLRIQY
ncbi:methyltransferase, FxLD system [Actinoplanes sp. TBRC 11911]|uniref:methyltransferase, FxLD system n=1 Tax=Actinoplanes sp. TBRC 11911 TaxID=2729386 RepID=UPI00145DD3F0|nr:methyltransferase, FxLD system [Actinoplanes sp. TBRC 11911]NMO55156.1 methyltransferase, FxLD system [Actinoplanes sp. TBRC 11911]